MKHKQIPWIGVFVLAALLALGVPTALAQDDGSDGETPVTGDAEANSLAIVRDFLENLNAEVLADDIVFEDPMLPPPSGSEGIFFSPAFSNQRIDPLHYYVFEDTVIAEFIFIADHTGTFYGAPGTDQEIAQQMSAVFRTENDQISRARLYYDLGTFGQWYGTAWGVGARPAVPAGANILDVDQIYEEGDTYLGQAVTVSGSVSQVLDGKAVVIEDQDVLGIDLDGQEHLLVLGGSAEAADFEFEEGQDITVTGIVREFDLDALEQEAGYELNRDALSEHEDLRVLVVDASLDADMETEEAAD